VQRADKALNTDYSNRPDELQEHRQDEARAGAKVKFSIARWSAWSSDRSVPLKRPEIPEVPMLLRRRASFADCIALRVAFDAAGPYGPMPAVFSSRHGEVHRAVEMLESIAKNEPFSPMTFGLSVHNTAATLYSIARGDTSFMSALAAGPDSTAEGFLEACGILAAGASRVLLVAYDDALPKEFGGFADEADRAAALSLVLEPAGKDGYSLELSRSDGSRAPVRESQTMSVARFLKEEARELEILSGARRWIWRRDA
jgi:hypothetical protein